MDIQELRNRIKALEDLIYSPSGVQFDKIIANNKIYSTDKIIAKGNGIELVSSTNFVGADIRTGTATSNATIITEIGTDTSNGSIYLSSAVGQIFVKSGGTWVGMNTP